MKGGAVFIEQIFQIDFNISLLIFTLVIAAYVIAGGMKGVMYTDALQAVIMFACMLFLLFSLYQVLDYGEVSLPKNISIGYLPEERGLFLDSTVQEHFELFARLSHVKNRKKRIDHWLDRLDIKDFANISLKNLSKRNCSKVQIGITFIEILNWSILDEPFSGLDPVNTELLKKLIIEESKNKFIIISSHQMNQIEEICKEAIFIKAGKIVDQGEILDLKKKIWR